MDPKVFETVTNVINDAMKANRTLSLALRLKEDLSIHSMKMIMILSALSTHFELSILDFADYELIRMKTVGDLTDLISVKIKNLP